MEWLCVSLGAWFLSDKSNCNILYLIHEFMKPLQSNKLALQQNTYIFYVGISDCQCLFSKAQIGLMLCQFVIELKTRWFSI